MKIKYTLTEKKNNPTTEYVCMRRDMLSLSKWTQVNKSNAGSEYGIVQPGESVNFLCDPILPSQVELKSI